MNYPSRGSFYAAKYLRLLTKSCAAQTLGPEACWLLAVVAFQEDAKRYSGAVTFYNEQLMPLCGFGSRKRLVISRAKAVESGWLYYRCGGKGIPGTYWTTVPSPYQALSDAPIDESSDGFCRSDSERQTDQENICRSDSELKSKQEGDGKGAPSLPIPIPKRARTRTAKGTKAGFVPPTIDEVQVYCQEAGLTQTNPAAFCDHYSSNGWKIGGKSQMRDWRAALRNWDRRQADFKTSAPPPSSRPTRAPFFERSPK